MDRIEKGQRRVRNDEVIGGRATSVEEARALAKEAGAQESELPAVTGSCVSPMPGYMRAGQVQVVAYIQLHSHV